MQQLNKRNNFKFYKVNICNQLEINNIFQNERPDVVINFAAESHVDRSIDNSRIFIETNILGTNTLLDACVKYNVKRFHQISTDEVYGDLPLTSNEKFTENSPLKPSSPYSASKASADMLVLSYFRTHNLPVTISRSTNNYGQYQHVEKMIPKTIKCAINGTPISVYGDGLNVRDWMFVNDHCLAIDLIVHKGKVGSVYNVGANELISNISLVKQILQQLGKSEELITFVEDRKGHDKKYAISSNKIYKELGWVPMTDFNKGLCETIQWYKDIL